MGPKSTLADTYRARRAALARFLTARLGSQDDAEDVLQELYLHLEKADSASDIRDPAAYLFRAAANLARDYVRTRRRAAAREVAWATLHHSSDGGEAVDDSPSAEREYDARQRMNAINQALGELSPQCRRIFVLHKLDGLSHQEISQKVNISRSTVEKHMHTALKHLIKRLGRG